VKFVILLYGNPAARELWERASAAGLGDALAVYAELNRELTESGELIACESLAGGGLRLAGLTPTDGPFAEAKEVLAGFYLVDVASMERAVEIVRRIPEAAAGTAEIRPVRDLAALLGHRADTDP
jgi:hypothetical protein